MATVPISAFVRFVITTAAVVYSNWTTIESQFDRLVENATAPIFGYYSQHIWQMKDYGGAFTDKERAMFGVHWVNTTGGDLDTTWTTADYTAVETAVQNYWTAEAAQIPSDYRLVEHRWYPFGPAVVPPNPPARITTLATPIAGTQGSPAVHQVSATVTLRTPLRRHWGRIYLPMGVGAIATNGQWSSGSVDARLTPAKNMLTAAAASQGVLPVVWDRNRKSALGVTAYEMDSVPDIIRRRRPRTTGYKKILTS